MPLPKHTPSTPPVIEVVNAHLPGQVARMRADTVRGSWKPRTKGDRAAVDDVNTPSTRRAAKKRAASKSTAPKAASGSAPAVPTTTEQEK